MSKYINLVTRRSLDPIGPGKVIGIVGPGVHWASRRTVKHCWYTYKKNAVAVMESFEVIDQRYYDWDIDHPKALRESFGDNMPSWEIWMNMHGFFEGKISLQREYDMQYFRKPQEVEVRVHRAPDKDFPEDWVDPVYFVPREPRGYAGMDFTCVRCGKDHSDLHRTSCREELSEETLKILADDGTDIHFADYFFGGRPTAESKLRRRASD